MLVEDGRVEFVVDVGWDDKSIARAALNVLGFALVW